MANENTLTTSNDIYLAAVVDTVVIEERRPYDVMRPFFRTRGNGPSNIFSFPILDDPGAASAKTEGTTLSNHATNISTSAASATLATIGIMTTITDELSAAALIDTISTWANQLGRSIAEKFETDAVALIDDFTNTTGTSGVDYTWAQRQEAVSQLESRDAVGMLVEVLHPQQVFDLRQDMTTSTAAIWGNTDLKVNGVAAAQLAGFVFEAFGVPTYQTSLVNTANSAADRAGGMFVTDLTLGLYQGWPTRTELERDASNVATEVVVTERYGMIEIRDAFGESIITDA